MAQNNLLIMGDSYSTFEGYIPKGFNSYYTPADKTGSGLDRVEQTWWHQVVVGEGYHLVMNNSYSGSAFCNTGYTKKDVSATSFLGRLNRMALDGFFVKHTIDCAIIFGGTNDDWAEVPIEPIKRADWTVQDLYSYGSAVFCFFHRIRKVLPDAVVYGIVNSGLREEIRCLLLEACAIYNVKVIELLDVEKVDGHPTVIGMRQIAQQVQNGIQKWSDVQ